MRIVSMSEEPVLYRSGHYSTIDSPRAQGSHRCPPPPPPAPPPATSASTPTSCGRSWKRGFRRFASKGLPVSSPLQGSPSDRRHSHRAPALGWRGLPRWGGEGGRRG